MLFKKIAVSQTQVGDFITRSFNGITSEHQEIVSIHGRGTDINGKPYICGYSDYFGDYPQSSMSFSAKDEDEFVTVYRKV